MTSADIFLVFIKSFIITEPIYAKLSTYLAAYWKTTKIEPFFNNRDKKS